MLNKKIFEEPTATNLELKRAEARKKRRIIYDCLNAQMTFDGVTCGHHIITKVYPNNTVSPLQVFRGVTPSICQTCPDYRIDN